MVGATVDQLLKQNFYHLESWKKSGMLEVAEEALATGIEKRKDVHVVSTFGKEVWFTCRFVPFQFEDEPHLLALFTDITERKREQKALQESEQKLRNIIEHSNEIYYVHDTNQVLSYVSPQSLQVLGYTPDEIIIEWTQLATDNPINEKGIEITEKALKTGEKQGLYILELYKKDRSRVLLEINESPLKDGQGNVIGMVGAARDVTERKRLEEQLHQAQKMESVGQLAGGVAHDFNNLLTAIIGYGNLLKTEVSQDNLLLAYVTQILNSAKRAADLTHNLLAFSRKQMINPTPLNVNNIIISMKTFLSKIISEDIEISIFPADQDLTVMADKHQIEQVLINLVTNARDAMPDGGSLTIRTEYKEVDKEFIKKHGYVSTGAYALISVEDAGQGMNEETKERLFDPFYTTKEVGKGTGLGLSMVYGIIKQHNGYIDVQSELGKGTTFNIYLPLTSLTVEEDKKPEDLPILKGGTETILLAEDETYVRDFIKGILTGYGYKVIEAIDGEDAIKVLHTHKDKIQLAILDVIMPKKNGEMVHQEIKKVSPNMKVIFISGYATDILYKKGIIEEGLNFISKPMSPDELLIKVREVLDS